jgi:hypothetical protein
MLMTMADTFNRATKNQELTTEMKAFAKTFFDKFRADMIKEQKDI